MTAPKRTRAKQILLRVTPEEHRTLSEAARRAGLGVGPFLRAIGLDFARMKYGIADDLPAHRRVASRRGKT